MKQSIFKTGNSLAVTIPADLVKLWGIKPGDKVDVTLRPQKGEVCLKFGQVMQLAFSDSFFTRKRAQTKTSQTG